MEGKQRRHRPGVARAGARLDARARLGSQPRGLAQCASLPQCRRRGDLGRFIQCGGMASGASSIHGALHFKWVVNDSPYSLGKQTVNIDNYMFWKLHGWIDGIWERYRIAKGLTVSEPKLTQALIDQCHEMAALGRAVGPARPTAPTGPLPAERDVFHEQVRPIFERSCASCHSEASPEAMLFARGADQLGGCGEEPGRCAGDPGRPVQTCARGRPGSKLVVLEGSRASDERWLRRQQLQQSSHAAHRPGDADGGGADDHPQVDHGRRGASLGKSPTPSK